MRERRGAQNIRACRVRAGYPAHDSRLPSARRVDKEEFVMRRKCDSHRGEAAGLGNRRIHIGMYEEKYSTKNPT